MAHYVIGADAQVSASAGGKTATASASGPGPGKINHRTYMAKKFRVANARYAKILASKGIRLGPDPKKPISFLLKQFEPIEGRIIKINAKTYQLSRNAVAKAVVGKLPLPYNALTRRLNVIATFYTFAYLDPVAQVAAMASILPDFMGKAQELLADIKGTASKAAGAVGDAGKLALYNAAVTKYNTDVKAYALARDAYNKAKQAADALPKPFPEFGPLWDAWNNRYNALPRMPPLPVPPKPEQFGLSASVSVSGLSGWGVGSFDAFGMGSLGSTDSPTSQDWYNYAASPDAQMDTETQYDSSGNVVTASDSDLSDPAANDPSYGDAGVESPDPIVASEATGEGPDAEKPPSEGGSDSDAKNAAKTGGAILLTIPQLVALMQALTKSVSLPKGAGKEGGGSPVAPPPPEGQPGSAAMQGQAGSLTKPVSSSMLGGATGVAVAVTALAVGAWYLTKGKKS